MSASPVPTILEVEASGFGPGSYPIEIGYVLGDGTAYCTLIRPAPGWIHWDPSAEAVHGIRRELLELKGRPVDEVALDLNARLHRQVVYSDAWGNDLAWLGRLFETAELVPAFRLESLRSLLTEAQAANWHAAKDTAAAETRSSRHRASRDADVLRRALLRVKHSAEEAGLGA